MSTAFVFFFVSLIALTGMFWYRSWELKSGKISFPKETVGPLFSVSELIHEIEEILALPKRSFVSIKEIAARRTRLFLNKSVAVLREVLLQYGERIIDRVKGKHIVAPTGRGASPFIKDILAHKENFRNNKEG